MLHARVPLARVPLTLLASAPALVLVAAPAAGQCRLGWLPSSAAAVDGIRFYASTWWDPDGAGPEPERLVVGGRFSGLNDLPVENVALWDGRAWRPLGDAITGTRVTGTVRALTVHSGRVYAGTGDDPVNFPSQSGDVFEFDGRAWRSLGVRGPVHALASHEGALYAGGTFTPAQGGPASRVARWDGVAWSPLGEGVDDEVRALRSYGGRLFVGGRFTSAGGAPARFVAAWDGQGWTPLGDPLDGPVFDFTTHQGELIAVGSFASVLGVSGAPGVARFDGVTWRGYPADLAGGAPLRAASHEGDLYVGPTYLRAAGGGFIYTVARWDGVAWSPVVGTFTSTPGVPEVSAGPGGLFVGGATLPSGARTSAALLTPSGWTALTTGFGPSFINTYIRAVGRIGDVLLVATPTAGTLPGGGAAGQLSTWDGTRWRASDLPPRPQPAWQITQWRGRTVINADALHVLEGATWTPLQPAGAVGRLTGIVYDMLEFNNDLLVSGRNIAVDGVRALAARWDGTAWTPVAPAPPPVLFDSYDLTVVNGELVVTTNSPGASGLAGAFVLRGGEWVGLGPMRTASAIVYSAIEFEGDLVIGGTFNLAATPTRPALRSVARWDGESWAPMNENLSGVPSQFLMFNGELYAVGAVETDLGEPVPRPRGVARWTGSRWESLAGARLDGPFLGGLTWTSAAVLGDRMLLIGSNVTRVDGRPAAGWAVWGCVACPPDLNADGVLSFDDLQIFVGLWAARARAADINNDGEVGFDDVQAFVQAFNAGC